MLSRCDGPACRLRASDCGLGTTAGEPVACLRRCETPVAAADGGRALTIVARGRTEPWSAPPLPPQPGAPVLLRDAAMRDQATLAAARRRGAYAALAKLDATAAAELVSVVRRAGYDGDGAFAGRVLCERDPHLVLEGLAIAARAQGRKPQVSAPLAAAAAEARELIGEFVVVEAVDAVDAARFARAAASGAGWWERHGTIVCAVSGDVLRPGLYELADGASIGAALAAAGGVVDGVRVSTASRLLADGVVTRDLDAPAPVALVAYHARRDPIC
ncbi:MAG: SLBB domain-containing protein [Polyangia bacterium]